MKNTDYFKKFITEFENLRTKKSICFSERIYGCQINLLTHWISKLPKNIPHQGKLLSILFENISRIYLLNALLFVLKNNAKKTTLELLKLKAEELHNTDDYILGFTSHLKIAKTRNIYKAILLGRKNFEKEIITYARSDNSKSYQEVYDGMHYTESKRMDDSDRYIESYFSKNKNPKKRNGIFIGGSIGITALNFKKINSRNQNWNIVSFDLFHPKQIAKKLIHNESFSKPNALSYIVGDMRELPFHEHAFDFIDVSNSIGYIPLINDRIEIVKKTWKLLKHRGVLRFVTPSLESSVEQAVFIKMGDDINNFFLFYVSLCGKSKNTTTTQKRLKSSMNLTQGFQLLRKIFKNQHSLNRSGQFSYYQDRYKSLLYDILSISPLSFGIGLPDLYRMNSNSRDVPHNKYECDIMETLIYLLDNAYTLYSKPKRNMGQKKFI